MTRTVALADDAYSLLAAEKGPGESFSDVARRLVREHRHRSIASFAGAWADESGYWEDQKRRIETAREGSARPPPKVD